MEAGLARVAVERMVAEPALTSALQGGLGQAILGIGIFLCWAINATEVETPSRFQT